MHEKKITDEYDNITFSHCTNIENDRNNNTFKYLLLPIPSSKFLFSVISSMIFILVKTLITNK